jgi:D-alanyl-D-alanine carboxypeptidase
MTIHRPCQTLCLAFLTSVFCAAQTPPTPSPAAQQLTAWLAAYDGTNWDAYLKFLQTNFVTPPAGGFRDPALRDLTGGFTLKKIEQQTPTTVTALLEQKSSDGFSRLTLDVEPAEPHRILKLTDNLAERPPEFALPHLPDNQLIAALRHKLDDQTAAGKFSGAVLLAHQGKPIFAQAYGQADREHNLPNTLNTRFSIASMNKMFTAVATMQLVQAGKLSLDDPLAKYLPNYPNKELASKVTISELLTNTGGTGDIWGPEFDQHRLELRTPGDYIHLYGNRALRFEPGGRYEYSNYGFILLGAVIEKVSGENYDIYMRDHVYLPARMTSTGSGTEDTALRNRSIEYTKIGSTTWHPTPTQLNRGTPAGGGYSTVGDLLNFANALRENKLLDAPHTKLLETAQVKNPFGFDAYGFGVQTMNGTQCVGHNGSGQGVNGDLEMCAGSTYTVITLANIDPPAAEQLSQFIINRLPVPKPK